MPRSGPLISSAATLPSAEPSRVDNYPAFYTWFGKQPRGPDLEEREEPFLFRALDELLPRKVFPPRPSRVSSVDGRFNFPLPSSHHLFDDSTNFSTELGRKGALRAIRCIRGSQTETDSFENCRRKPSRGHWIEGDADSFGKKLYFFFFSLMEKTSFDIAEKRSGSGRVLKRGSFCWKIGELPGGEF